MLACIKKEQSEAKNASGLLFFMPFPILQKEKILCLSTKDFYLADPKGFEPLTFWSVARRSIQLS